MTRQENEKAPPKSVASGAGSPAPQAAGPRMSAHPAIGDPTAVAALSRGSSRGKLGEMLVQEGVISPAQLEEALRKQQASGGFLGQLLVDLGYLDQNQLVSFLVKQCKIPHISLIDYQISPELFSLVPQEVCLRYSLVPIDKLGRILTVAMVDPLDVKALEHLRSLCPDLKIKPILCDARHYETVAQRLFSPDVKKAPAPREVDPAASPPARKPEGYAEEPEATAQGGLVKFLEAPPAKGPSAMSPAAASDGAGPCEPGAAGRHPQVGQAVPTRGAEEVTHPVPSREDSSVGAGRHLERFPMDKVRKKGYSSAREAPRADAGALQALDGPPDSRVHADERVHAALQSEMPDERYTFAGYLVGPENAFTLTLAKAMAGNPGREYSPFYLHGSVGAGKTHLICAIGNHILANDPDRRVGYVSASRFAHRLQEALQERAMESFRENYCRWDVLILDDIQFLANRREAQEELLSIFNALYQEGRPMIIAGDKAPDGLADIERGLVSRFSCGIVAGLAPPAYETRLAILRRYAGESGVCVTDEVLDVLAKRIPEDVRKMCGALRKVVAFARLVGQDITIEATNEILSHLGISEAA